MKKLGIFIVALLLITPTFLSAAWWNPFTWFNNQKISDVTKEIRVDKPQQIQQTENTSISVATTALYTTRFYIKYDGTRLRKCASTTCDVKGYYSIGQYIDTKAAELPTLNNIGEWIEVTEPDGSKGFLNKSVLSETPVVAKTRPTKIEEEKQKNDVIRFTKLTEKDIAIVNIWSGFAVEQKKEAESLKEALIGSDVLKNTPEALTVVDNYLVSINTLQRQLIEVTMNEDKEAILALIEEIKSVSTEYGKNIQTIVYKIKKSTLDHD